MDLYLVHTPSHMLIALNLIRIEKRCATSTLLVVSDFPEAQAISDQIIEGPFKGVVFIVVRGYYRIRPLKFRFRLFNRLSQLISSIYTVWQAKRKLVGQTYHRVFIFNDTRHEIQSIMGYLKENGTSDFIYVDEGFAPYRRNPIARRISWVRGLFGKAWYPLREYGSHPLIKEAILIFPSLAHPNLRSKKVRIMPPFCLEKTEIEFLLEAFGNGDHLSIIGNSERRISLLLLPHSGLVASPGSLIKWLKAFSSNELSENRRLIVKYHPRESKDDYLDARTNRNTQIVSQTIPGELIGAAVRDQLDIVISIASSSVLLLRWVCTHCRLVVVQVSQELTGPDFNQMFSEADVDLKDLPALILGTDTLPT